MARDDLIQKDRFGLSCSAGGFTIDPWRGVETAVITHGHADHARRGSSRYLCTPETAAILEHRLGKDTRVRVLEYGDSFELGDTRVSLHPAGHLLGAAQVRVERGDEVWVVTGDYKRQPDPTCHPFEVVPCNVLISECTFGLPIYRWPDPEQVVCEINDWWRGCQAKGRTAILSVYSLGKAQRVLGSVDASIGPIAVHGAIHPLCRVYREMGVALPDWVKLDEKNSKAMKGRALVLAPPAARNTAWIRKLTPVSTAAASGWMRVRGRRRHAALDRGFVLSDHADWPGLLRTFEETGAKRIGLTHGNTEPLVRYLCEQGWGAFSMDAPYNSDGDEQGDEA